MKRIGWAVLSGLLVWLVPFVVAVAITPIRTNDRTLFETIMPVVLCITAVVFLVIRPRAAATVGAGLALGAVWMAISIGVDLLMFMWGPMKMTLVDYMKDIGLVYLMYPVIAGGAGCLAQKGRTGASA